MMGGVDDMLEVYHTDTLLLGDKNGDYTISSAFFQTLETEEFEFQACNIIHKGNWRQYRYPTIWKNLDNTGFCPSNVNNIFWGVKQPDALCNLPPVDLNTWVHLTYHK